MSTKTEQAQQREKKLHNHKVMRRILRYVRQTAGMFGTKVVWDDSDPTVAGSFYFSGNLKSSIISLNKHSSRDGKTIIPATDGEIAETALHELAHALQAARGDYSYFYQIPSESGPLDIQTVRVDYEEGTSYFARKTRDTALRHIMHIEREAEEFSILMMHSMGFRRRHSTALQSGNSSLLQQILMLRHGIRITSYQSRLIRKLLTRTGHLSRKTVIDMTPSLLTALDEIVREHRAHLEAKSYAYWAGKKYIKNM